MPLQGYGVLTARVIERRREGAGNTPHYQIHAVDGDGTHFRIAVNVLSQESPSELLYLVADPFAHPLTEELAALAPGWHPLPPPSRSPNLDLVRGNLLDRAQMRSLPPDVAGPDNDLADLLDHHVQRAIADPGARLHAFGQRWGPEAGKPDEVFGFAPGNGVHDIHMNQGNSGRFRSDDGVWQDGGLVLQLADRWVAILLAFQSQAWHTDDATGHALGDGGTTPPGDPAPMRILAAMVNPPGPAPEQEHVLLLNASPAPLALAGWRLADRAGHTCAVGADGLAPGATLDVTLADGVQLGNSGGTITLLDDHGLKVAGVAYTREDAAREGWTVVF